MIDEVRLNVHVIDGDHTGKCVRYSLSKAGNITAFLATKASPYDGGHFSPYGAFTRTDLLTPQVGVTEPCVRADQAAKMDDNLTRMLFGGYRLPHLFRKIVECREQLALIDDALREQGV